MHQVYFTLMLSPQFVLQVVLLLQPNSVTPPEKQWTFPSSVEVMPPSQVVLLQPMVSNCSVAPVKTTSENNTQPKDYLPILKSYPRIAPHPGERPSKRQGSTTLRTGSGPGHSKHRRRQHHSRRPYSSPSATPIRQAPVKALSRPDSPALDAGGLPQPDEKLHPLLTDDSGTAAPRDPLDLAPLLAAGDGHDAVPQDVLSDHGNKLKRFSNTCNILNKSGLLGITLRTKQLMRDNRRTQGQLQLLQEHTDLLMEALRTGDPRIWTRLQLAMQDKASPQCEGPQREGPQLGGALQGIPV